MDQRHDDRAALKELKARYFRLLDTKQWAEWRELFTDDMIFIADYAPVPTADEPMTTNGDEFVEMVSQQLEHAVTVHHGHTCELRFEGDRDAYGIWAMFDWVDSSGSGGGSMQGYGHYHEHYVRGGDGKWRIAHLRLTRLRMDQTPGTGAVPPPVAPWKRPASA